MRPTFICHHHFQKSDYKHKCSIITVPIHSVVFCSFQVFLSSSSTLTFPSDSVLRSAKSFALERRDKIHIICIKKPLFNNNHNIFIIIIIRWDQYYNHHNGGYLFKFSITGNVWMFTWGEWEWFHMSGLAAEGSWEGLVWKTGENHRWDKQSHNWKILYVIYLCLYKKCTNLWRWNTGTRCVTVDMVDGLLKDHSLLSETLQVLWACLCIVMLLTNLHV